MTELSMDQLHDLVQQDLPNTYKNLYNKLRKELADNDYRSALPKNIDNNFEALFTLHKFCVVGSSIAREGMLAPLQMQFRERYRFQPHPGADRYIMLTAMQWDRVHVQWDLPDYVMWKPDLKYTVIGNATQLRSYYRNWDTSLVYLADYKVTDKPDDHQAFMKTFVKGVNKYVQDIGFTSNKTYYRLEIKNSKGLFQGMADETDRFMNSITTTPTSITAGPFTVTEDNLIFDGDRLW